MFDIIICPARSAPTRTILRGFPAPATFCHIGSKIPGGLSVNWDLTGRKSTWVERGPVSDMLLFNLSRFGRGAIWPKILPGFFLCLTRSFPDSAGLSRYYGVRKKELSSYWRVFQKTELFLQNFQAREKPSASNEFHKRLIFQRQFFLLRKAQFYKESSTALRNNKYILVPMKTFLPSTIHYFEKELFAS